MIPRDVSLEPVYSVDGTVARQGRTPAAESHAYRIGFLHSCAESETCH